LLKTFHELDHVNGVVGWLFLSAFDCSLCWILASLNIVALVVKFDIIFRISTEITVKTNLSKLVPQFKDDSSYFGVTLLLFKGVQINNEFKAEITNEFTA